ncbi:MAG: DUF3617 domain-containing protein [Pseudorhodoplanes sp.]
MRRDLICAAVAILAATPAAALDLPARKAGLWEIKTVMDGGNHPAQVAQHCIDAETDKLMNSIGGDMRKEACSRQDVQKVGPTYVIDSVCKFGPMTSTSHGVVTGDFNSAYTVKLTSKREGGPNIPGMPAGGTSTMTIEAKWLGACAAGQKPGDMILAGGRKVNIRDMQNIMKNLPKGLFQKN